MGGCAKASSVDVERCSHAPRLRVAAAGWWQPSSAGSPNDGQRVGACLGNGFSSELTERMEAHCSARAGGRADRGSEETMDLGDQRIRIARLDETASKPDCRALSSCTAWEIAGRRNERDVARGAACDRSSRATSNPERSGRSRSSTTMIRERPRSRSRALPGPSAAVRTLKALGAEIDRPDVEGIAIIVNDENGSAPVMR